MAASRYFTVRMPPVAAASAAMNRSAAGWSCRKLVCEISSLERVTEIGDLDTRNLGMRRIAIEQHHGRDAQLGVGERLQSERRRRQLRLRRGRVLDDRQRLAVRPHPSVVVDRDRLVRHVAVDRAERPRCGGLAAARRADEHHHLTVRRRDARGVQHPCAPARGLDRRERHLLREAGEHVRALGSVRRDRLDRLGRGIRQGVRPRGPDRRLIALVERGQIDRDARADGVDEESSCHNGSLRGTCRRPMTTAIRAAHVNPSWQDYPFAPPQGSLGRSAPGPGGAVHGWDSSFAVPEIAGITDDSPTLGRSLSSPPSPNHPRERTLRSVQGSGVIIHEWVERWGGAERVLDAMTDAFPDADVRVLWNDTPELRRSRQ